MTTRNYSFDTRVPVIDPNGSTHMIGEWYQRSSSGGNYVAGEPAGTPHNYDLTMWDNVFGYVKCFMRAGDPCFYGIPYLYDSSMVVHGALTRAWSSNDDANLYSKLADKFDEHNFSAPIFAGELGETADMLADNLRRLAKAARQARKGDLAGAAKTLGKRPPQREADLAAAAKAAGRKPPAKDRKDGLREDDGVSSRWLELQYGWKPLLGDIYNLAGTLQNLDTPRRKRVFARQYIPKRGITDNADYVPAGGSGKYGKQIIAYLTETQPTLPERMGLYDPATILWELLPFSFVADWVLPIGDYLSARSIRQRAKGTFVITTIDKHYYYGIRFVGKQNDGCFIKGETAAAPFSERKVSMSRRVYTSLPAVELPTFENPLGGPGTRLANAVALVASIFGSKRYS